MPRLTQAQRIAKDTTLDWLQSDVPVVLLVQSLLARPEIKRELLPSMLLHVLFILIMTIIPAYINYDHNACVLHCEIQLQFLCLLFNYFNVFTFEYISHILFISYIYIIKLY